MSEKGILVVVSGFSGAGKGTLMKKIVADYKDVYALSISVTSRQPREGDIDGRDYFFKTEEEFEQLIARDELIEYARYVDNYYGTPRDYVLSQINAGKDVILEIEIQGALQIKEKYPEAVLIFVTTKDAKTLEQRLRSRGTETEEKIRKRLKRAYEESIYMDRYEYILVNDDLDNCVLAMHELIQSQHSKAYHKNKLISGIQSELEIYAKGGKKSINISD